MWNVGQILHIQIFFKYFVQITSYYIKPDMNRFIKSMDGYRYFAWGHVQQIFFHDPSMDIIIYLNAKPKAGLKKYVRLYYSIGCQYVSDTWPPHPSEMK